MEITSALIIDRPWINKILNGEKDWEMRSTQCSKKGYIGLIEKGTGMVVGIAKLHRSSGPYSRTEMIRNIHRHGIPADMIDSGSVDKWNYAWELGYIQRLTPPVPYTHRSGAVTWVTLDDKAQQTISAQRDIPQEMIETANSLSPELPIKEIAVTSALTVDPSLPFRTVEISDGNINNNHIYLRNIIDFFPDDTIGGKNKTESAPRTLSIKYDTDIEVETDIAGDKKIFRSRTGVKNFFTDNDIKAGDRVKITRLTPYTYRLTKADAEC